MAAAREEALRKHQESILLEEKRSRDDLYARVKSQDKRTLDRITDMFESNAAGFESNDASTAEVYMKASLDLNRIKYSVGVNFHPRHRDEFRSKLFYKAQEMADRMGARIFSYDYYMNHDLTLCIVFTWNPKHKAITEDRTSWWQRMLFPTQEFYKIALKYPPDHEGETNDGVINGPPGGPST